MAVCPRQEELLSVRALHTYTFQPCAMHGVRTILATMNYVITTINRQSSLFSCSVHACPPATAHTGIHVQTIKYTILHMYTVARARRSDLARGRL